jgi:hypothetical protein
MSASPLPLWQVLKEEYESFGRGQLPDIDPPVWNFARDQLFDPMRFWVKLEKAQDGLSKFLKENLLGEARENIKEYFQRAQEAAERSAGEDALSHAHRKFLKNELLKAQDDLGKLLSARLNVILEHHDLREHCEAKLVESVLLQANIADVPPKGKKSQHVNRLLLEEVYAGDLKPIDAVRVSKFYEQIRKDAKDPKTVRSALCLSGGGIRSATFNLGILQGLARHGLLDKFDYLSTVSGGGFIGSWLTAWIHRKGINEVISELKDPPKSPLEPDPKPIYHLRVYSNYLSPQPGLLSADTWTLISMAVRNLLLTWLVFVPWLVAVLMVPRMSLALISWRVAPTGVYLNTKPMLVAVLLVLGGVAAAITFAYISYLLPSASTPNLEPTDADDNAQNEGKLIQENQGEFIVRCLLPLTVAACFLAAYNVGASELKKDRDPASLWQEIFPYIRFAILVVIPAAVIYFIRVLRSAQKGVGVLKRGVAAGFCILLAQAITGCLLWFAATSLLPDPEESYRLYVTFAPPVLLIILGLDGILVAGFTSRFTTDDDQEWWGRSGAWILIVVVLWVALHLLVLYAPSMILQLVKHWNDNAGWWKDWGNIGNLVGTLTGVVSGIIALYGGFSSSTPANDAEARKSGTGGKLLNILTLVAAPVFLAFLLILLALGTNWLLVSRPGESLASLIAFIPGIAATPHPTASWQDHKTLVESSYFIYLFFAAMVFLLIGALMGRAINTNIFSAHNLWRNRIIRAYLGASRAKRHPNSFTGFDTYDNIYMHELRRQPDEVREELKKECRVVKPGRPKRDIPQWTQPDLCSADTAEKLQPFGETREPPRKLFHVLNIALNLAGGDRLAWQDRKAESFTVSPLHAGSYWLGYRRAHEYGGDDGISLGTAVAVSGAFVSPNMGYMMSSPILRFLMTLFNVRFGWWLGNTGAAGASTDWMERIASRLDSLIGEGSSLPYKLASPRLSVFPIVKEAFGRTNDKSSYVYLSDGGHFENLGLYEMVLRRCRFIVVSDASTDASYSFDSLASAIRQIRVDLGVPIEISDMTITSPSQDMKGKYCAVGKIRYSCVDRDVERYPDHRQKADADFDGTLIYIKASMIGDEPRDVINYGQGSVDFPQEVIVDQWFSEAQFESYRALGSHIVDVICADPRNKPESHNQVDFTTLAERAQAHNKINFRIFKERASYAAFEEAARKVSVESYHERVKQFMDDLLR